MSDLSHNTLPAKITPADAEHKFYEHVDGGLYRKMFEAKSSEDSSPVVIYEHLHPFEKGVWSRPLTEFARRFAPVDAARAASLMERDPEAARREVSDRKARRKAAEALASNAPRPLAKLYSLGLMFSLDGSRVALIRKKNPAWQAGKLNGIGGKAEPSESSIEAMTREFQEEAGVLTRPESWSFFARIGAPEFEVHAFCCFTDDINSCQSMTAEDIVIVSPTADSIARDGLPGLSALLHAALDHRHQAGFARFDYRLWAEQAKQGLLALRQPEA